MTGEALHLFDVLAWRLARTLPGMRSGDHTARMRGAGERFADTAQFLAHPDPRRLDLRRSMTDPFGSLIVRRFQARTGLTVHLLLDASASLATVARADRLGLAALLTAGLAQAARRGRDRFAMTAVGGENVLHREPAGQPAPDTLEAVIAALTPAGRGIEGLARAAGELAEDRILVVLVSDFEFSPDELRSLLAALEPRPVWPVWLRDSGLEAPSGRFGIAETRDPETGKRRSMLTTRRWAERQRGVAAHNRTELRRIFSQFGLRPIEISDQIDVPELAAALEEAPL